MGSHTEELKRLTKSNAIWWSTTGRTHFFPLTDVADEARQPQQPQQTQQLDESNDSQRSTCIHAICDDLWQIRLYNVITRFTSACCESVLAAELNLWHQTTFSFLPCCMECRRGLAMRILSVCPSVRHTRGLWQNGRKICRDLYTTWKSI